MAMSILFSYGRRDTGHTRTKKVNFLLIIISYYRNIVISYYHDTIRPHDVSRFGCQVKGKNTNRVVFPFAKDRIDKINALRAITFHDAPASDAQTIVAPPKHLVIDFTPIFCDKKASKLFVRRRKIKSCKSPETRFPKVSRRSEPSSGCKQPFEIFAF